MKKRLEVSNIDVNVINVDMAGCIILTLVNNKINNNSLSCDSHLVEEFFFGNKSDIYYDIYKAAADKFIKKFFKGYKQNPNKRIEFDSTK